MRILFCFCFPRRRVGACLEGALNDAFLDLPYLILLLERTPEALASGGVISSVKGNLVDVNHCLSLAQDSGNYGFRAGNIEWTEAMKLGRHTSVSSRRRIPERRRDESIRNTGTKSVYVVTAIVDAEG